MSAKKEQGGKRRRPAVPASKLKVKTKPTNRASAKGSKATAILYGTRGLKEQAIRAAIQYHKEHPEETIDDVLLYRFGISIAQRRSWVGMCNLREVWDEHHKETARAALLPAKINDPHKYDEDNRIKLMRRVLNGMREDVETPSVDAALAKYGEGIDSNHFYRWLKAYDSMTWELRGIQLVLEGDTFQGRSLAYECQGLNCPEVDQITALMAMLHLYSTPQSVARKNAPIGPVKGQAIELGFMDREECLRMVGLSHWAWWMMTNKEGMFHEAWLVAVGKRDRAMSEIRQDQRAKLKLLVDDALVMAMTPHVVTQTETVISTQYDKFGNEVGMTETVKRKTQEAPDPKFIPYVHKYLGEAPREEVQQSQHYIIYEEAATETRLEVIGTELERNLEELEQRRLERKSEVMGEVDVFEAIAEHNKPVERSAAEDV